MIPNFTKLWKGFPYEDMTEIKKIVLSGEIHKQLIERLNWGFDNSLEDGGFITIVKKEDVAIAMNFYTVPDEFKELKIVNFYNVYVSSWLKKLERKLRFSGEKIGLRYHTHALLSNYPQIEHEEWCHARHNKTDFRLGITPIEKTGKKLGDLVIEMTKDKQVIFHGYTPAKEPYKYVSSHGSMARETHSLEIIVPEMNLKYNLKL